ncbi:MAG: endolytic transglycosylase MltG [Bifidobacteriaceae bacterium]|jgi:UPF0755 protein|nr:endolytic transglycosylase MltG [Bifidobacteriaceae bacterium]
MQIVNSQDAKAKNVNIKNDKPNRRKFFIVAGLVLVLIIASFLINNIFLKQDFFDDASAPQIVVTIPEGSSTSDIANLLVDKGIVKNASYFVKEAIREKVDSKLQAGSFNIKTHQSSKTAIEMLLDENNKAGFKLSIPEGYTASEIVDYISTQISMPKNQVQSALENAKKLLPKAADGKSEGYLFPATYILQPGQSPEIVFRQMITKALETLKTLGVSENKYKEVLTKASIVQKEVFGHDYYGKVARVIDNRLSSSATDYHLGMDTVIAYGLGINALDLTKAQLADSSNPYNDRIHTGLPPTPISNPGVDAINAVLNPPDGNWIYFCTVNLVTGETKFTNNSEEFEQYKAEYQKWMKDNPDFDKE